MTARLKRPFAVSCWLAGIVWTVPVGLRAQASLLDRPARLDIENVRLESGLRELQRTSGVGVAFSPDRIPSDRRVTCHCLDLRVRDALDRMLDGSGLRYVVARRQILIGPAGDNGFPVAVPTAGLTGQVVDSEGARPIAGARVTVLPVERRTATDGRGRFDLEALPPGEATVRVTAIGYGPAERTVRLVDGEPSASIVIALGRVPLELGEIVIAPGSFGMMDASPALMTATLDREEIEARAQFGDDAFRTLMRMPGVASQDVSTKLNVRGAGDRDLLVRLDGLELFEPYHLKDLDGVFGIVDLQSLEGIDLITGGFPAEFGDRLAGVFDMRTRRPPPEGIRTTLGVSIASFSFINQGGFGRGRGEWLFSARRGFLDIVLDLTDSKDEISPAYWDVLGRARYFLNDRHRISAELLLAGDDLRWRDDANDVLVVSNWNSGYGWLTWQAGLGERIRATTMLSAGRLSRNRNGEVDNPNGGIFTPLAFDVTDVGEFEFAGIKQDWEIDLTQDVLLKAGADLRMARAEYDYLGWATRWDLNSQRQPTMRTDTVAVNVEPDGTEVGSYLATRFRFGDALTWEVGARYDHQTHTDDSDLSPRLLARWDLDLRTTIKASWGLYRQSQGIHELQVSDGEESFTPSERADQVAVGIEHRFGAALSARIEAYHRTVGNPRPEFVNLSREVNPIMEVESDRVRLDPTRASAQGIELILSSEGAGPFRWSASYALARARQRVGGQWVPRTLDQPHTLNLFGSLRVEDRWQLSASWQYHTGWPYTEQFLDLVVVPSTGDSPRVEIVRHEFGPINAERVPAYHRLDLRATRRYKVGKGNLEVYLDLFNALGRTNVRGFRYFLRGIGNGEFTAQREVGEELLPRLPTIGMRWIF